MFNSKENGFSLIELIVVLIITAILAQIGFVAFNLYSKRTKAFAAKTALLSIQKECQNNKALGTEEIFSNYSLNDYQITPKDSNSCLGNALQKLIKAMPTDETQPIFSYDHISNNFETKQCKSVISKTMIINPPDNNGGGKYTAGRGGDVEVVLQPVEVSIGNQSWVVKDVKTKIWPDYPDEWMNRNGINKYKWLEDFAEATQKTINKSKKGYTAIVEKQNKRNIEIYSMDGKKVNNIIFTPDTSVGGRGFNSIYAGINAYAFPSSPEIINNGVTTKCE